MNKENYNKESRLIIIDPRLSAGVVVLDIPEGENWRISENHENSQNFVLSNHDDFSQYWIWRGGGEIIHSNGDVYKSLIFDWRNEKEIDSVSIDEEGNRVKITNPSQLEKAIAWRNRMRLLFEEKILELWKQRIRRDFSDHPQA